MSAPGTMQAHELDDLHNRIEDLGLALRCMLETGRDEYLPADLCESGERLADELVRTVRAVKADCAARVAAKRASEAGQTGGEL